MKDRRTTFETNLITNSTLYGLGLQDFTKYPQFSTIKRFVKYSRSLDTCYAKTTEVIIAAAYDRWAEAAVCDLCSKKAKYVHLTISAKHCSFTTLWTHHTFCTSLCHDYYYSVLSLGGTP